MWLLGQLVVAVMVLVVFFGVLDFVVGLPGRIADHLAARGAARPMDPAVLARLQKEARENYTAKFRAAIAARFTERARRGS